MADRMALAMAGAMANRMAKPMRSRWQNDAPNPNPNPNPNPKTPSLAVGLLEPITSNSNRYVPQRAGFDLERQPMTPDQIARLAALGNALRPDWPANSLRTFITKNLDTRGYGDTAVAIAYVATKTETTTPRLLLEAGPWWRAALGGEGGPPANPRPGEACTTCGKHLDRCQCDQPTRRIDRTPPTDTYRAARAALRGDNHD